MKTIIIKTPKLKLSITDKNFQNRIKLESPKLIYNFVKKEIYKNRMLLREEAYCLYFNSACKLLGVSNIGVGLINSTTINIKEIFQTALLVNATAIVIIHNHPSGNIKASNADNEVTKQIKKAANLLNIELLDHIIVCENDYYSYSLDGKL